MMDTLLAGRDKKLDKRGGGTDNVLLENCYVYDVITVDVMAVM